MGKLEIKTKGYFGGDFTITSERYVGVDFSKYCFIFQGQGGIVPEMCLRIYDNNSLVKEKFKLANIITERLGIGTISDYITNPKKIPKSSLHIYGNIALYVLQVGLFDSVLLRGIRPKILTSHSFGEYAMLAAAGVISFEDMLRIVCKREMLSEKPNTLGFLIAVKSSIIDIKKSLEEGSYYISNVNSFNQTVISVDNENIQRVVKALEGSDIKYFVLQSVPQPYHSPLMNVTQEKFSSFIDSLEIDINPPKIDLFSSVSCELINKDNFKKESILYILKNQLTNKVNFLSQIVSIYELGSFNFLEIGPQNIFSKMLNEIILNKEYKTSFVLDMFTSRTEKENKHKVTVYSKILVDKVNKVIQKITGYSLVDIRVEDRFQEDMGIDSIKKANILFKVLDELDFKNNDNLITSDIKTVKDMLDYLDHNEDRKVKKNKKEKVFNFERYSLVDVKKEAFVYDNNFSYDYHFIDIEGLLAKDISDITLEIDSHKMLILKLKKSLSHEEVLDFIFRVKNFLILFNSFGNVLFFSDNFVSGIVVSSFLKSLKREGVIRFFKYVYIEKDLQYDQVKIDELIKKEIYASDDIDVFYKKEGRFIPEMIKDKEPGEESFEIDEDTVLVVIGGASGAARSIVKNLLREYKCFVHVIGRRNLESVGENIKELEKINPGKTFYHSVDATKKDDLGVVISTIYNKYKKIDVCINGAGLLDINFLQDKKEEVIKSEFETKVKSSLDLLHFASVYKIKKVILFSSIVSYFGSAGQSVYVIANMFLNSLESPRCTILNVINWPPWDNVGMTESTVVLQKLKEFETPLIKEGDAYKLFKKDFLLNKNSNSYYLTDKDEKSMDFMIANFQIFESLIGKAVDTKAIGLNNIDFVKNLNPKVDVFLRDHMVLDTHVVPAAYFIASSLCLSSLYFRDFVTLKDVNILNTLSVKEEKDLIFSVKISSEGITISAKANVILFSSKANFFSGKASDVKETQVVKQSEPSLSEIVTESVYKDYFEKDNFLSFGASFRTLEAVYIDEGDTIRSRLNYFALLTKFDLDFFHSLIPVIDSCFQLLSVSLLKDQVRVLPVSIETINFFRNKKFTEYLDIIVNNIKIDTSDVTGDAFILNSNNDILFSMLGVRLKKLFYTPEKND